jgi:hypothetical protein
LAPPAPSPRPAVHRALIHAATRWAATALERECTHLARMSPDTGRNHALNRAAFNLGQLVATGHLTHDQVVTALTDAALACGLSESETTRTLTSGLSAGMTRPRTARSHA